MLRPIHWIGSSLDDIRALPVEIRVHASGEFRVMYVAKFTEAVYVLHAFGKKPRKTPKVDLELAKDRYAQVLASRRAGS